MRITNKELTWYYKHLLFRDVQVINNILATKLAISEKKMPVYIEKPIQDILDDLVLDLGQALLPLMAIAKKEYSGREDRQRLFTYLEERLNKEKDRISLKCHCAACEDHGKDKK